MKSLFLALFLTSLAFGQGDLMDSLVRDSVDTEAPDSIPAYEIIIKAPKSQISPVLIKPSEKEKQIGLTNDLHELQQYLPGVAVSGQQTKSYSVEGSDYTSNLMVLNDIPISFPAHLNTGFPKNSSVLNMESVGSLQFYNAGAPSIYGFKTASVLEIEYQNAEKPIEGYLDFSTLDVTGLAKLKKGKHALSLGLRHGFYYNIIHLNHSLYSFGKGDTDYDNYQFYYTYCPTGTTELDVLYILSDDQLSSDAMGRGGAQHVGTIGGDYYFSNISLNKRFDYNFLNIRLSLRQTRAGRVKIVYGREVSVDEDKSMIQTQIKTIDSIYGRSYFVLRSEGASSERHTAKVVVEKTFAAHRVTYGVENSVAQMEDSVRMAMDYPVSYQGASELRAKTWEGGIFADDRFPLKDKFEVRLGGRLDRYFMLHSTIPSIRVALQFNPTPQNSIVWKNGMYNQEYPLQCLKEGVTKAFHSLLGWVWQESGGMANLETNIFLKREINVPDFKLNALLFSYDSTFHDQTIAGVSPSLEWNPTDRLELSLNYTYIYPNTLEGERPLATVRPHTLKSMVRYSLDRKKKVHLLLKSYFCSGLPYGFQEVRGAAISDDIPLDHRFPPVLRWDLGLFIEETVPGHVMKKLRAYYNFSNSLFPLPQQVFIWIEDNQETITIPDEYRMDLGIKMMF